MSKRFASVCSFLFLFTALSGCIAEEGTDAEPLSSEDESGWDLPALIDDCIEYEGLERCWFTHLPSSYNPEDPPPLLVNMHGFGGTNSAFYNYSQFDAIAEAHGVVVVYPQGHENSWNAGWCCGEAKDVGLDDVGFILSMIETISDNITVDDSRIYASGHSNGCAMTHKLANEASHVFAAAGCMALYLLEDPHPSYSPISLIEVHGVLDGVIPYGTSYSSSMYFDGSLDGEEGAIQNIMDWAEMNGCEGSAMPPKIFETYPDYSVMGYDACEDGTEVNLVTLNFAAHVPYTNSDTDNPTNIDTVQLVWDFISRFSKSDGHSTA